MRRTRTSPGLAFWIVMLLVGLSGSSAVKASAARPFLDEWEVRSAKADGASIWASDRVRLVNRISRKALTYGERKYGINLVWGDPSGYNNVILRPSRPLGRWIEFGDRVAIAISSHGYLTYRVRKYGINLGWSSAPRYEWTIFGLNPPGTGRAVRSAGYVSLYNTRTRKFLGYGERKYGINLIWFART
jgi:hypothetical protein